MMFTKIVVKCCYHLFCLTILCFGSKAYNNSMAECDFSSTILLIKFRRVGFCEEGKTRESEEKKLPFWLKYMYTNQQQINSSHQYTHLQDWGCRGEEHLWDWHLFIVFYLDWCWLEQSHTEVSSLLSHNKKSIQSKNQAKNRICIQPQVCSLLCSVAVLQTTGVCTFLVIPGKYLEIY